MEFAKSHLVGQGIVLSGFVSSLPGLESLVSTTERKCHVFGIKNIRIKEGVMIHYF